MKSSNKRQVGGDHYRTLIQHWDYVWVNNLDYFQGQIIKYVTRWEKKNGIEDLKKAQHFLEKYIELLEASAGGPQDEPMVTIPPIVVDPARDYPFWECQGSVGTSGDRGIYRCLKCGFKITAHDFAEASSLHGNCSYGKPGPGDQE
jgi:hypothetical protein